MPKVEGSGPFANRTAEVWDVCAPNFQYWRDSLGLSQRDAARKLGLSLRAYTYYEHGERRVPTPVLLACEYLIKHQRGAGVTVRRLAIAV